MAFQLSVPSTRDQYVTVMKALGDPTRLQMVSLIGSADEYACIALERELHVTKSTISYHVKILSTAGLINVRREGRFFFYSLRRESLDHFVPDLVERLKD